MIGNSKFYDMGYRGMLEKCAQFDYDPFGIDKKMYYEISEDDQKALDKRLTDIDNAQRKYDQTKWYNPADWFRMIGYKWQEGHNKRELERTKKMVASRTANSDPIGYYAMKSLRDHGNKRFIRVDPNTVWNYKETRNNILSGLDNRALLRYLTQNAREGREYWDKHDKAKAMAQRKAAIEAATKARSEAIRRGLPQVAKRLDNMIAELYQGVLPGMPSPRQYLMGPGN